VEIDNLNGGTTFGYLVQYEYENAEGTEEVKVIEIFSSEPEARKAIEISKQLPGFSQHQEGYALDEFR
jgi:LAS superfamily LD-carboxypeptidase LdcB